MSVLVETSGPDINKMEQLVKPSIIQDDGSQQVSAIEAPQPCDSSEINLSSSTIVSTSTETNPKKKKTRRGKSKRKLQSNKPYNKMPWQIRRNSNDKDRNRMKATRAKILEMGHTLVPCNTNQFLMEDHMLHPAEGVYPPQPRIPSTRTRDSSFSVDSEDNYFMSLPEDEEDFLTKEFSCVYENAQCERLSAMPKEELIQEYILMETRLDKLTKKWRSVNPTSISMDKDLDIDAARQHIKEQQQRIDDLLAENIELRRQRDYLSAKTRTISSSTSTDSESDSSMDSSSESDDSSSRMSEGETTEAVFTADSPMLQNQTIDGHDVELSQSPIGSPSSTVPADMDDSSNIVGSGNFELGLGEVGTGIS